MFKLYLALFAVALAAQINGENVPAFIFGNKSPTFLPTLQHLNGDEFVTLVKSQADKDTLTVVFVENKLSVEDLSQCKLNTKTCFENLRKTDKTYLSSVEHPVDSLINAFGKQKSITVTNDNDLKEVTFNGEKILFVYLDDVERPEDYSEHDKLISKSLEQLQSQYGDVIAVYTSIHPTFKYSESIKHKVKREAEPVEEKAEEEPKSTAAPPKQKPKQQEEDVTPDETLTTVFQDKNALLAFKKFIYAERSGDAADVEVLASEFTMTVSNVTESELAITLQAPGHKVVLQVSISAGTWQTSFRYNDMDESKEKLHPRTAVVGYGYTHSFGCGDLYVESFTRHLRFTGFQFQPDFEGTEIDPNEPRKFSENVSDCVGFFSPGIWGALFVIFIMVSILTYGISMMMDIRTMDKFDDPKGKTIIINAAE
ncbi:V-type proton ATPase subunit S1 [Chironomus tepperi]|uniref:V-type proton ATPase subunit S1 n=1 Tax=Chironomus tepperi TaxID=113505 RepID=UPI00391FBB91